MFSKVSGNKRFRLPLLCTGSAGLCLISPDHVLSFFLHWAYQPANPSPILHCSLNIHWKTQPWLHSCPNQTSFSQYFTLCSPWFSANGDWEQFVFRVRQRFLLLRQQHSNSHEQLRCRFPPGILFAYNHALVYDLDGVLLSARALQPNFKSERSFEPSLSISGIVINKRGNSRYIHQNS